MFLAESRTGDLVEVLDLNNLSNPCISDVQVRFQHGEEVGDPEVLAKSNLRFPSGECLPRCWLDSHYRDEKVFCRFGGAGRF